jgi:hypothetical protein
MAFLLFGSDKFNENYIRDNPTKAVHTGQPLLDYALKSSNVMVSNVKDFHPARC